jgi:beta-xylosidase
MKINRLNIAEHLIEYQLNIVGKTIEDAKKDDMWFFNWTMTQEQADEFKAYAIPLIKKVFKCNKSRAENTFSWFSLEFGLRVKD